MKIIRIAFATLFFSVFAVQLQAGTASGTASGTIVHPKGTLNLKFAYLIKGPDLFDASKMIRKVILSTTDMSAKIAACAGMSCADSDLNEGITLDLGDPSRIKYWLVLNGQLIQFSGTKEMTALKISADDAKRLAGKLSFDDGAIGGGKVDATFDADLVKEFSKSR